MKSVLNIVKIKFVLYIVKYNEFCSKLCQNYCCSKFSEI